MKKFFHKIYTFRKLAVWLLIVLNLAMATSYTYAVNRTVFNVVAMTKAQKTLAQSDAATADLESTYISLNNNITLDFAYSQGFQDASDQQIFIDQKPVGGALSFNAI